MNYAYLYIDNLDNHHCEHDLDEITASISALKTVNDCDNIIIFNNEITGKNIEFFKNENLTHFYVNPSKNYKGSNNINPINILVEKIRSLMNFNENEDIVLMDVNTAVIQEIPPNYWDNEYVVLDDVEYPIMQWRNLDKVLPLIPWDQFNINFDNSFMMYNTGVIYIPKKFRKEICKKALEIVDYLNDNFDPENRYGNKLDEHIALSIVLHEYYGKFGKIKFSNNYIRHYWKEKQNGINWWENIITEKNKKYDIFTQQHYSYCLDLVNKNIEYLKDKVIIDIGSNIGLFAKAIAETISYKEIHVFEPAKEYLNESKKILNPYFNITFNNYGLGEEETTLTLYKSTNENIGWNTVYKKDPLQSDNFFDGMNTETIKIVRLDDYYKNINSLDFIKIDVEGYERQVLEGAWNLIEKFKPYILVEIAWGIHHPDWNLNKKIYQKLFALGYEEIDLDLIHNTQDILFKPTTIKNNIVHYSKLPLSVGILSWNSKQTLKNTLNSYKENGLFDVVDDVILFFQSYSKDDIKLANEYNISFIAFKDNIGIGNAFLKLAQIANNDNILLLEHDWQLIEHKNIVYDELKLGIELLNSNHDCIRYRHRKNPGYPLYTKLAYENNELNHYDQIIELTSPHLIECCHWIDNVDQIFPDKIQKENSYYITTSRWSAFTNNPCMYKKDFYIKCIDQFKHKSLLLENDISYWWARQNFKIAWNNGLFTHNDIDKYK